MAQAESAPHYRGDLRQTALPEMLAIIDRTGVSGVVEAVFGEFSKQIYLDRGCVVHAASNDIADSLGAYLRRSGRISDGDFEAVMERRHEGPRRLGEVLIERGVLAPDEAYRAIREQIEAIVWSLFSWEEGDVKFAIGPPNLVGVVRIQVPLRQAIVQGIKRAANAKSIVKRLGGRDSLFEPSFRYEDLIEIALEGPEYELLRRVDGKRRLYELCTDGPVPAADAARLLYAFSVLGVIRRTGAAEPLERTAGGIRIKLKPES
jgi:hypothetical protein